MPSTTVKEQQQQQRNNDVEDDIFHDDENNFENMDTEETELDEEIHQVELTMDIRSEIIMLKKRLLKTELETKKMNELKKELIKVQKENISLKKIIQQLKNEQKNISATHATIIEAPLPINIDNTQKDDNLKKKEKKDNFIENKKNTNMNMNNTNLISSSSQQVMTDGAPPLLFQPLPTYTDFPYLAATKQNLNNNSWTRRQRNQFYRRNNPSKKQLELVQRTLVEKTEDNNFINIYLPASRRMKPSEIRKMLSCLGIDNIQILDAYSPDWDTVALLIHEKYKDTVKLKTEKAGIMLKNYDYYHISHLRDSRLQHLTADQKVEKLKEIRNNCSMRALDYIRNPVKKSVARCFYRQQLITEEQLKQVLTGKKTIEDAEAAMEDVVEADAEGNKNIENEKETQQKNSSVEEPSSSELTGTQQQQATNNI